MGGNLTSACTGSAQDCAVVQASVGRPQQATGLESMWTQSLITGFLSYSWEGCSAAQMPRAPLQYPGMSMSALSALGEVQGGGPSSMVWVCNRVIDPVGKTCKFTFAYSVCALLSDEDCDELVKLPLDTSLLNYFNSTSLNMTT